MVGLAVSYVRAKGGDADGLIREFGLPHTVETDTEVVLPLPGLHAFLEAAERESKDPFMGLHVAGAYRRGVYGVMEYACRSAPTVREAFLRIVRFGTLMNDIFVVTYEERDGAATIEQSILGVRHCLGRHANECLVATLFEQARLLSGERLIPGRVWFAHPRPRRVDELTETFGTLDITFDAEANGFTVPTPYLELPLVTADPSLLGVLDEHATQALSERPPAPDFVGQVRACVRERMRGEAPTVEIVAKELGLSPRTLQRRLTHAGTSFQKMFESVREDLARAHVSEGKMALGEIAFVLGYADLSAFLRAFKRWTGKTPRQFRGE